MNKVVVISGGSKGLGLAMVKGFLNQGNTVATFSRSITEDIVSLNENKDYQNRFYYQICDICDVTSLQDFVKTVHDRFDHIDVLINNAGAATTKVLTMMALNQIDKILEINLSSAIKLTQMCTRVMLAQQQGVIINISSIIASRGYTGLSAYSASKAGLEAMTRSLARELGGKGIRVNAIAPGYIETEMSAELSTNQLQQIIRRTPLAKLATADDVFQTAAFLASNRAKSITGQIITIDGGLTC